MNTTILKFNDITIVINECESNKQMHYMNNAYISYHRGHNQIEDWRTLTRFEAKAVETLVDLFCDENKLIKWQF